jgi:DNA-binding MarR family transcriptional regulator
VEALLSASRVMVGVAARSLAGFDADVTLPQFRTLMVLATHGPQRAVDVSTELGVNPSTGTRMCDRLVRKGLIRRTRSTGDRRVVRLALTPAGRKLVAEVTGRRREELSGLVAAIPSGQHAALVTALRALSEAAGEPPEDKFGLEWSEARDDRSATVAAPSH